MSFKVRRIKEDPEPKGKSHWKGALFAALGVGGSLFGLIKHGVDEYDERQMHRQRRSMILKRVLFILLAVLFASLLFAGTVRALVSLRILSFSSIASITGAAPPADENGYTNILLLGQGDSGHDGLNLTDTIMVASIDPTRTQSVVLLSLPRDLYFLNTERMGKGRLNSMYRDFRSFMRFERGMDEEEATQETISELAAEIGRKLNIEMHGTIKVDFIGFVKAVDAIGGVDLDVPYDIVDTEYPDENYGFETFEISKGMQHLNGETALKYARSRHTTSDFGRSARQQQLLGSIGDKAKETGLIKDPKKLVSIARIISDHMETTFSFSELVGLAALAKDTDGSRIIAMQLNDRNGLYDAFIEPGGILYTPPRDLFEGASVLLPVSIPEYPVTWRQVRAFTALLINQRAAYLANPKIAVLNSSAKSGSARRLGNELNRFGFEIGEIANASGEEQLASIISYEDESAAALAEFFSLLLDVEVAPLPEGVPPEETGELTIILGEDFAYTPMQDLVPNVQ